LKQQTNLRQKRIQKQYKIMTYRLGISLLAISSFSKLFAFDVVIFSPMGVGYKCLDARKLGFVLCCIYTMQNANKFTIATRRSKKYITNFGTKALH
jgi:hypothetical protein